MHALNARKRVLLYNFIILNAGIGQSWKFVHNYLEVDLVLATNLDWRISLIYIIGLDDSRPKKYQTTQTTSHVSINS